MSQLSALYRLQQIDSALGHAQERLQKIQQLLSDESALQTARTAAEETARRQHEAERQLRRAEEELQNLNLKIQQTEASLYSGHVRNPRELQDLQNDAISLKKHRNTLEERVLEAMLAAEEAAQEHARRQEELARLLQEWETQKGALAQEQASLQRDILRLQAERAALLPTLSQAHLALYEELRQSRRGIAVIAIRDNACGACGATLTPAQVQAVRSAARLEQCPSCNRILYAS